AAYLTGPRPTFIVAGDFRHNGKTDLVAADDFSQSLSVLTGNGDGTFNARPSSFAADLSSQSVTAADVNGDGKLDLITLDITGGTNTLGFSVFLGNGDGTFASTPAQVVSSNTGGFPFVAAGDLNGDSKPDLVLGPIPDNTTLVPTYFVELNNGDGTFRAGP